ncbi:MAG: hypothetical protein IH987_19840, partial [Planctomycetes bacterium]|nr:hypothetical protein [Planctomycetota bacterium]
SDSQAWEREYTQNVHAETLAAPMVRRTGLDSAGRFEADHPVVKDEFDADRWSDSYWFDEDRDMAEVR